jgi:hypothetical protein
LSTDNSGCNNVGTCAAGDSCICRNTAFTGQFCQTISSPYLLSINSVNGGTPTGSTIQGGITPTSNSPASIPIAIAAQTKCQAIDPSGLTAPIRPTTNAATTDGISFTCPPFSFLPTVRKYLISLYIAYTDTTLGTTRLSVDTPYYILPTASNNITFTSDSDISAPIQNFPTGFQFKVASATSLHPDIANSTVLLLQYLTDGVTSNISSNGKLYLPL